MTREQQAELSAIEERIKAVLPGQYQDSYEDVQPTPMGGAGLKFGEDGNVAWDEIWGSFCDLAMAGGPPHKGKLLESGSKEEVDANPERYGEIVAEICRGIGMVTGLEAEASPDPGWVRVDCFTETMAGWLVRAITMENVAVRCQGRQLNLPASPSFRLEKEIKSVITVLAKTCHYWQDHMWPKQQREIGEIFSKLEAESPLVQPSQADVALRGKIAGRIERGTGLRASGQASAGWLGLACPDVRSAIWMMRAMVVSNVLARREGTVLFVPVDERVVSPIERVHQFAKAKGVL